jgi:hypothetical protein
MAGARARRHLARSNVSVRARAKLMLERAKAFAFETIRVVSLCPDCQRGQSSQLKPRIRTFTCANGGLR